MQNFSQNHIQHATTAIYSYVVYEEKNESS